MLPLLSVSLGLESLLFPSPAAPSKVSFTCLYRAKSFWVMALLPKAALESCAFFWRYLRRKGFFKLDIFLKLFVLYPSTTWCWDPNFGPNVASPLWQAAASWSSRSSPAQSSIISKEWVARFSIATGVTVWWQTGSAEGFIVMLVLFKSVLWFWAPECYF